MLKYAPFSLLTIELLAYSHKVIRIFNGFHEDLLLKCFYILFFALIGLDLYVKFFEDPATKFSRIYGGDNNFLSRLSTLERKRWIV